MPLTVSQGEGMTVITVTSDSDLWLVLCQILGFLCYSPVCCVSQKIKGKLKDVHTALGVVQMIVGVLNIVVGIVFTCVGSYYSMDRMAKAPFWLGSMFLVAGIMCILTVKFPNFCLLVIGMILNIACVALAITAVVLYSVDLANDHSGYNDCNKSYDLGGYDRYRSPSPEDRKRSEICLYYKNLTEIIFSGLDIMMIVLSVLQICVTISYCVLTGKALCKKDEDEKMDPELYKPLLEDAAAAPAC